VSESFTEHVDVLIVGSGPTGAAYARTIADSRPNAKVLVVEVGPVATQPPGNHVANIADRALRERAQIAFQGPNRRRYAKLTHEQVEGGAEASEHPALIERPGLFAIGSREFHADGFPVAQASSGVGGMGAHWFGACPRPHGSERINLIDPTILDDAYDAAERLLKVSQTQFTNHAMSERLQAVIGSVVNHDRQPERRVQQMPMALVRTDNGIVRSGPNVIFGGLVDGSSDTFELRPGTLARRIIVEGDRAVGVEILDRASGAISRIGADHVVVAADSARTPQLLFASGIRPPALGRHLNEHPQVSLMAVMNDQIHGAAVAPEVGDTGVMSDPSAMVIASSGVIWIPFDGDRFPFHAQITHVDPGSLGLAPSEINGLGPIIALSFFLPQEIAADNRVEFSDTETDWLGMPAMRFHHRLSGGDHAVIERAKTVLGQIADALGSTLNDEKPRVLPSGASLHYEGTVRMGARDDGTSVCDPNSRVWGTRNVYVAGNGVIPTSTACNPTLTSVALAIVGAREIVRQLNRPAN
jgi:pyranose oxidase